MTLTRRGLVRQLQEQGFNAREAADLTSVIIDAMVAALHRKETVELSFGRLEVRPIKQKDRRLAFGTIIERFKGKYRVVFRP